MDVAEIVAGFPEAVPDIDSRPYWDAALAGELTVQRCTSCNKGCFPPRAGICARCGGDLVWTPVARTGKVYSWVGVDRVIHEWQADLIPYTVVVLELDDASGARIECLYLDDRADLSLGAACEIQFKYAGPGGVPRPVAVRL